MDAGRSALYHLPGRSKARVGVCAAPTIPVTLVSWHNNFYLFLIFDNYLINMSWPLSDKTIEEILNEDSDW